MIFKTKETKQAITDISKFLLAKICENKRVVWLVSGGSCIGPQAEIMNKLSETLSTEQLRLLTILPIDERYGPYGHKDSNSEQMRSAGFKENDARWIDILGHTLPFSETVTEYSAYAVEAFRDAQVVVATLGMGSDGHIAGILPASPAVTDTVSTAVGFSWSDYERLTLGIAMLLKIDHAWLLAYGESKKEALERLRANEEPIEQLPAKLLYDLPDVTVYNDYITS